VKLIQKTFVTGEEKCHSRRFTHANYHAPKGMKETYKAVDLLLGDGITIRSVSSFKNKIMALAENALAVPVASTAPILFLLLLLRQRLSTATSTSFSILIWLTCPS
jgi:hypothetical protein